MTKTIEINLGEEARPITDYELAILQAHTGVRDKVLIDEKVVTNKYVLSLIRAQGNTRNKRQRERLWMYFYKKLKNE